MSANTKTTIKSHGVKTVAIKAYVKGCEAASHAAQTVERLYDATPAIWAKASEEANAEIDAIFAELGL